MRAPPRALTPPAAVAASLSILVLLGSACQKAPPESAPPKAAAAPADQPAPGSASPVVPAGPALSTPAFHLAGNGVVPEGCFAWSPKSNAAACTVGLVGNNMPGGGTYHAEWKVAFLGDAAAPALDLTGGPARPDSGSFRTTEAPAASVRAQLEAALAAGGYVELKPLLRRLSAGAPLAWEGAEILWTRRRTSPGGQNMAPRYTDTLTIRWEAGGAPITIETREDAPVEKPEYAAYLIPGGRFAVLSDVADHGDEGVSGVIATAFRCDRAAKRCK